MKGVENIEEGAVKKEGRRREELGGKGGCLMQPWSESGIVKRRGQGMGEEEEEEEEEMLKRCSLEDAIVEMR